MVPSNIPTVRSRFHVIPKNCSSANPSEARSCSDPAARRQAWRAAMGRDLAPGANDGWPCFVSWRNHETARRKGAAERAGTAHVTVSTLGACLLQDIHERHEALMRSTHLGQTPPSHRRRRSDYRQEPVSCHNSLLRQSGLHVIART